MNMIKQFSHETQPNSKKKFQMKDNSSKVTLVTLEQRETKNMNTKPYCGKY
jgi:hypothetical protein